MVGRTLPSQSLTLAPRRPTLTAISATFARGADVRAFRRRILLPYSVKRNRTFARRALRTLGARTFASEFLTLAQNQRTLQGGGRTFAPGANVRGSRPRKLLPHSETSQHAQHTSRAGPTVRHPSPNRHRDLPGSIPIVDRYTHPRTFKLQRGFKRGCGTEKI